MVILKYSIDLNNLLMLDNNKIFYSFLREILTKIIRYKLNDNFNSDIRTWIFFLFWYLSGPI